MRSLFRFIFTFLSSVIIASFILSLLFSPQIDSGDDSDDTSERISLGDWFSFRDAGFLFSPTATITITDDNSTFFNAKPAAFGPSLPLRGLSGQVWVGSGFGDDNVNRRGMAATIEGELGCADIPGWKDSSRQFNQGQDQGRSQTPKVSSRKSKRGTPKIYDAKDMLEPETYDASHLSVHQISAEDDGTDDHLHHPFSRTGLGGPGYHKEFQSTGSDTGSSDIQSMQEAAGIAGKIVLLSRGGCGFSEKVKWAQRRGAKAVIIADSVRGGPLVRMYARGDVSNITIPSIFTSHTTAHLLSHLIPPSFDTESHQSSGTSHLTPHHSNQQSFYQDGLKDTGHGSSEDPKAVQTVQSDLPMQSSAPGTYENLQQLRDEEDTKYDVAKGSSGKEINDVWQDNRGSSHREDEKSSESLNTAKDTRKTDGFVIGVQDWRDPDVVQLSHSPLQNAKPSNGSPTAHASSPATTLNGQLRGGSITPGSGEYEQPGDFLVESKASPTVAGDGGQHSQKEPPSPSRLRTWLGIIFGGKARPELRSTLDTKIISSLPNSARSTPRPAVVQHDDHQPGAENPNHHTGLWVTLTPTDMNANPFLNTLFVLVISPLITLAVVYSMLILRTRIRRRAWRAPKSVVDRLPVRTYTALSSSSSPEPTSPPPEPRASVTTPLLSTSRITESLPDSTIDRATASASTSQYGSLGRASIDQEKVFNGLAEWRRRYGGKQKECVVCLEEYVDGVSRVMSLPCGHEFHADCITPWLTFRRRTCPICKGDVVRSLHHVSSPIEGRQVSTEEEDVQQQAGERRNLSPSASRPISPRQSPTDIERAEPDLATDSELSPQRASWLSRSFARGRDYLGLQQRENRNR